MLGGKVGKESFCGILLYLAIHYTTFIIFPGGYVYADLELHIQIELVRIPGARIENPEMFKGCKMSCSLLIFDDLSDV